MTAIDLKIIFNAFDHDAEYSNASVLTTGHINDTYLINTLGGRKYVLQSINHHVFNNVPGLIRNKVLISNHIKGKLENGIDNAYCNSNVTFVKAKASDSYFCIKDGSYWNLMLYIENSVTHVIANQSEIAYEAGKLLGDFLNMTSDFDSKQLTTVIPHFHDMDYRLKQYRMSIQHASNERMQKAAKFIKLIDELKDEMSILQNEKEAGNIPLRVTHNDAKLSNALFDKNNKGICMIDLDTVMEGIIHYDYGDAIRTICNTTEEDQKDLSKVEFNVENYIAYTEGFLEKIEQTLTPTELKYLPLAVKTMIFIMALRFLTDYLQQDIYYKTQYPEHNLDRAKNQFKLLESFYAKGF